MDENLLRFNKSATYCFFDAETENLCLYMEKNLPWQVAMLNVVDDKIIADYMRYIKWYRPPNVSHQAAIITRFEPEMVSERGTNYKEVIEDVVNWTSEAEYLVGHNILGFDIYFLYAFYQMVGRPTTGLVEKVIDTHCLAKGLKLNYLYNSKKSSLLEYQYKMLHTIAKGVKTNTKFLGQEYGIEHDYDHLHDAIVDLHLNLKIWNRIKFLVEI